MLELAAAARLLRRRLRGRRRRPRPLRPAGQGRRTRARAVERARERPGGATAAPASRRSRRPPSPSAGRSLAFGFILVVGLVITLFATPRIPLDDIDYEVVDDAAADEPAAAAAADQRRRRSRLPGRERDPPGPQPGDRRAAVDGRVAVRASSAARPPASRSRTSSDIRGSSTILRSGFDHSVGGIRSRDAEVAEQVGPPVQPHPVPGPGALGRRGAGLCDRPVRRLPRLPVQDALLQGRARLPRGRHARGPDPGAGRRPARARPLGTDLPGGPRPRRGGVGRRRARRRDQGRRGQQAAVPDLDRRRTRPTG